jgi:hypothetical protein
MGSAYAKGGYRILIKCDWYINGEETETLKVNENWDKLCLHTN